MDPSIIIAVCVGIAATAAGIKALPVFWNTVKNVGKFFTNVEKIRDLESIQENQIEMNNSLASIKKSIFDISIETEEIEAIKNIAKSSNEMAAAITQSSIEMTIAGFKAHSAYCSTPNFIIAADGSLEGEFIWANDAWYQLHGIDYTQAVGKQYYNSIAPEDFERVSHAATVSGTNRSPYKIQYTHINQQTGVRNKVTVNSWPLLPHESLRNKPIIYLGGIAVL